MGDSSQIFQTSNPVRWKSIKWSIRILLITSLFLIVVVALAIINGNNPNLPNINTKARYYESKLDPANKLTLSNPLNNKYKGFRDYLVNKQKEDSIKRVIKYSIKTSLIRGAFYTPWMSTSLPDLVKNANKLNTIYPEWLFIDTINYSLETRIDKAGLMVMKKNNLSIQPIFNNFHSAATKNGKSFFDAGLAHVILNNDAKRKALIRQIADTLNFYHFQGINVDFEDMKEKSNEPLSRFQKELYETLHPDSLIVSMDVQSKNEDYNIENLAKCNDYVILMAYDQFSDATGPGPISSQRWIEEQLDWMDDKIDVSRIVLGVAGYARDWIDEEDENGKKITRVEDISYDQAIDKAKIVGAEINFERLDTRSAIRKAEQS